MGIAPWGALGGGQFKTEEQRKPQDGRTQKPTDNDIKISAALETIAQRKNTIITNVALAYVMHKAPYVFPIVGIRKVEHLKGNIDALSIELSDDDIEEIEETVPFDLGFPNNILWGSSVPKSEADLWMINMAGHFDYVQSPQVNTNHPSAKIQLARTITNLI